MLNELKKRGRPRGKKVECGLGGDDSGIRLRYILRINETLVVHPDSVVGITMQRHGSLYQTRVMLINGRDYISNIKYEELIKRWDDLLGEGLRDNLADIVVTTNGTHKV